ncbi:hypothetical protein NMY22_g6223 [Coprinellus aureogranulatus]|nr:hypothetical protein NMY22_g6223 [Coprinellus aureogranulatus]
MHPVANPVDTWNDLKRYGGLRELDGSVMTVPYRWPSLKFYWRLQLNLPNHGNSISDDAMLSEVEAKCLADNAHSEWSSSGGGEVMG